VDAGQWVDGWMQDDGGEAMGGHGTMGGRETMGPMWDARQWGQHETMGWTQDDGVDARGWTQDDGVNTRR